MAAVKYWPGRPRRQGYFRLKETGALSGEQLQTVVVEVYKVDGQWFSVEPGGEPRFLDDITGRWSRVRL